MLDDDVRRYGQCLRCRNGQNHPAEFLPPESQRLVAQDRLIFDTQRMADAWQAHGFIEAAAALRTIVGLHLDGHDEHLARALAAAAKPKRRYPLLDEALRETRPFRDIDFGMPDE
jgi:hypothetical protein